MAGLTNPNSRDKQIRTPVFIVAKDFVSGVKMRAGIANSLTHDIYLKDEETQFSFKTAGGSQNKVLPFDVKYLNGIVPKHEVNWAEISE